MASSERHETQPLLRRHAAGEYGRALLRLIPINAIWACPISLYNVHGISDLFAMDSKLKPFRRQVGVSLEANDMNYLSVLSLVSE